MQKLLSNQYGLALHTNTPQLGLTINNFQGDSRSQIFNLGRDLATHLHQYLIDFIKPQTWSNLAFLAVAKGPGGFTGTRIGLVTAKTMAQQLNIPIYSISNLAAIAHQYYLETNNFNSLIAVEMKAVRGQIFGGIYQSDPDYLGVKNYLGDQTYDPEVWRNILNNLEQKYQLIFTRENQAETNVNLLELAHLKWQNNLIELWEESQPFYGQNPVN